MPIATQFTVYRDAPPTRAHNVRGAFTYLSALHRSQNLTLALFAFTCGSNYIIYFSSDIPYGVLSSWTSAHTGANRILHQHIEPPEPSAICVVITIFCVAQHFGMLCTDLELSKFYSPAVLCIYRCSREFLS
jgi:hypothetical protein